MSILHDATMMYIFLCVYVCMMDVYLMCVAYPGGNNTLIATYIHGELLLSHSERQHLTFVPNAGLKVSDIAPEDFGQYSVRLVINSNSSFATKGGYVFVRLPGKMAILHGTQPDLLLPENWNLPQCLASVCTETVLFLFLFSFQGCRCLYVYRPGLRHTWCINTFLL